MATIQWLIVHGPALAASVVFWSLAILGGVYGLLCALGAVLPEGNVKALFLAAALDVNAVINAVKSFQKVVDPQALDTAPPDQPVKGRKTPPFFLPVLLIIAFSAGGCAWFRALGENPVVAVQLAEDDANLAVFALVREWNDTIKPILPSEDAAAFQEKLDVALAKFAQAEALALDAAKLAADGKANNWTALVQDVISSVADVVAIFDKLKSTRKLGGEHGSSLAFAHERLAHMRASVGQQ